MKKMTLELKVGVFVLLALAGLSWMVFRSGDFFMKPGFTVRFIFDTVSGIDKGSTVALAGVYVGEVSNISVVRGPEGLTKVEVTARIHEGVQIEEDAEARVNSLGFLGEKYIEILPGTGGKPLLSDGSLLVGKAPVVFEKLTESGNRLISKIELTVDSLNDVVAKEKFKEDLRRTFSGAGDTFGDAASVMKDLKEASSDLKEAAKSANIVLGRLRDGEGSVGRLLKDDKMAKDLEAFAAEIKKNPWRLLKRD